MTASADVLRLFAILLLLGAAGFWMAWFVRSPVRLYAVPILLWTANALAFLVVRALSAPLSPVFLNNWSLAIYIQAGITLLGIGLYAWVKRVEPRAGC